MSVTDHSALKLNRDLIDPNFGGYKLSLDPLPVYRANLDVDIDVTRLADDVYSYQHLKAFGVHNYLYLDLWNSDSVWFVDEMWQIQKSIVQGSKLSSPVVQYVLPEAANRRLTPNRLNVTLHFTTASWLALSDGTGWLYLVQTGNRQENDSWKVGYSGQPLGDCKQFTILHSTWRAADGPSCYIDVLCLHVDANEAADSDDSSPAFLTKLEWLTFFSENAGTFKLERVRRLETSAGPDYAAILASGLGVILMCEKPVKFTYDSVKPLTAAAEENLNNIAEVEREPAYKWTQTGSDVTAYFELPSGVEKSDVIFELHSGSISIGIKNHDNLLSGSLFSSIDVDASTWIIDDKHVLEVHLTKVDAGHWSELVKGDSRGQLVLTADQLTEMSEQLDKYTTDNVNADPVDARKPAFNVQQLEECDNFPDDSAAIWCFDGETHKMLQQVSIASNQWLFSAALNPEQLLVVCLRHDVDGVIWQPSEEKTDSEIPSVKWRHVGTFDAFGYVQASKQQRKFATCPPSLSYVAIADCVRHIYIYHRPASIKSPLRNRRTGETVSAVARQQLVSLESTSEILGLCANDRYIFAVSGKTLFAVRIGAE